MTELFGFAALAVGGYWIFKRAKKKLAETEASLNAMRDKMARQHGDITKAVSLVQDPVTGKYRPQS